MRLRQEIEQLQVGHLQSASLLFAFPEARDRWSPVEEFLCLLSEMEVTIITG